MKAFHAVMPTANAMSNTQNKSHQRWNEENRMRGRDIVGAAEFFREEIAKIALMPPRIVRIEMLARVGVNPSIDSAIRIIPITPGPRQAARPKRSNFCPAGISQFATP